MSSYFWLGMHYKKSHAHLTLFFKILIFFFVVLRLFVRTHFTIKQKSLNSCIVP